MIGPHPSGWWRRAGRTLAEDAETMSFGLQLAIGVGVVALMLAVGAVLSLSTPPTVPPAADGGTRS